MVYIFLSFVIIEQILGYLKIYICVTDGALLAEAS